MGKLFSPGKLMLTSEYVALDGALVLSVPTTYGQDFFYEERSDVKNRIFWKTFEEGKLWLEAEIDYSSWTIISTNNSEAATFIVKVLKNVQQLSSIRFSSDNSYRLESNIQFPRNYGLGSSSTLMANLSKWAEIDAYLLNEMSLGGSGYDIAVAMEMSPVLYSNLNGKRTVEKVEYKPSFSDELIFIHLNAKQDSREGISLYKSLEKPNGFADEFSKLTIEIFNTGKIDAFSNLMNYHETTLSKFLKIPTVKQKFFEDCPEFVKSLGAWGGDFVMSRKFDGFNTYFSGKGFTVIYDWSDIIY